MYIIQLLKIGPSKLKKTFAYGKTLKNKKTSDILKENIYNVLIQ